MDDSTRYIDHAGGHEPIVCAYGCVPQWPELPKPVVDMSHFETTPPKQGVDIDKIEEICAAIRAGKEKIRYLDELDFGPYDCIFVGYSNGKDAVTLITENHKEEISKGILELIRSHYENEIQRLTDELVREAGGSVSVSI